MLLDNKVFKIQCYLTFPLHTFVFIAKYPQYIKTSFEVNINTNFEKKSKHKVASSPWKTSSSGCCKYILRNDICYYKLVYSISNVCLVPFCLFFFIQISLNLSSIEGSQRKLLLIYSWQGMNNLVVLGPGITVHLLKKIDYIKDQKI